MSDSNYTNNPALEAVITKLENLADEIREIPGEEKFAGVIEAIIAARIVDGDESSETIGMFLPVATRIAAAMR